MRVARRSQTAEKDLQEIALQIAVRGSVRLGAVYAWHLPKAPYPNPEVALPCHLACPGGRTFGNQKNLPPRACTFLWLTKSYITRVLAYVG